MARSALLLAPLLLVSGVGGLAAGRRPNVVVVGRPNVGKSTLANRITQQYADGAIVHDEAGVTRDRTYADGWWAAHEFTVVDTGGLVFDDDAEHVFMPQIRQQAIVALRDAAVALLVVDGQAGCTPLDTGIADFMQRQRVKCVLAVNKCESEKTGELQAADFWQLGMGTPHPVSSIHGTGMGELMDALTAPLPRTVPDKATHDFCSVDGGAATFPEPSRSLLAGDRRLLLGRGGARGGAEGRGAVPGGGPAAAGCDLGQALAENSPRSRRDSFRDPAAPRVAPVHTSRPLPSDASRNRLGCRQAKRGQVLAAQPAHALGARHRL